MQQKQRVQHGLYMQLRRRGRVTPPWQCCKDLFEVLSLHYYVVSPQKAAAVTGVLPIASQIRVWRLMVTAGYGGSRMAYKSSRCNCINSSINISVDLYGRGMGVTRPSGVQGRSRECAARLINAVAPRSLAQSTDNSQAQLMKICDMYTAAALSPICQQARIQIKRHLLPAPVLPDRHIPRTRIPYRQRHAPPRPVHLHHPKRRLRHVRAPPQRAQAHYIFQPAAFALQAL